MEKVKPSGFAVPKSGTKKEVPSIPKTYEERENWQRVIVILEQANLETTKGRNG